MLGLAQLQGIQGMPVASTLNRAGQEQTIIMASWGTIWSTVSFVFWILTLKGLPLPGLANF